MSFKLSSPYVCPQLVMTQLKDDERAVYLYCMPNCLPTDFRNREVLVIHRSTPFCCILSRETLMLRFLQRSLRLHRLTLSIGRIISLAVILRLSSVTNLFSLQIFLLQYIGIILRIMVPVAMDDHWWCCVFNLRVQRIDVLDSLCSGDYVIPARSQLIYYMASLMELILTSLDKHYPILSWNIIQHNNVPKQDDAHSCGIFLIKFLELWDGRMKSNFSAEHISKIRKQLVAAWILK